jgi:hypothetical protein
MHIAGALGRRLLGEPLVASWFADVAGAGVAAGCNLRAQQ